MNFHEFTTQVISEMRRRFPGYDIQVQEVPKLQGESYTGMAIHPSGGDIALTMDLEALFDRFRNDLYLGNPMKGDRARNQGSGRPDAAVRHGGAHELRAHEGKADPPAGASR